MANIKTKHNAEETQVGMESFLSQKKKNSVEQFENKIKLITVNSELIQSTTHRYWVV